ncbi:uncharacterized protein LOC130737280 [Lotus japonicus]|uniref:uncharacterized protein LOC130737280 n=1 Tax=Lotus japonicus TaxID=34305 RepID=UPI00258E3A8E|nr:uncharacterized protein LOC130737280 [Lotus japonicus]
MIEFEDLNILAWNVRGAASASRKRHMQEVIRAKHISLIFLFETHVAFHKVSTFWSRLGFQPIHVVEAQGHAGGIWCLASVSIAGCFSVVDIHNQAITVRASKGGQSWFCTGVYASPIPSARLHCWEHLKNLRTSVDAPWMVLGDFNNSLYHSDQRGGNFSFAQAVPFRDMVDSCNLLDINPAGYKFTWVRRRGGVPILFKKLDWCFIDAGWRTAFPEGAADVLPRLSSDHHPILVRCGPTPLRGPRPFRFEAAWLMHEQYAGLVQDAWALQGDVSSKLELVKDKSVLFNKEVFGNIFFRKHELEARLRGAQRKLERVDSASLWRLHDSLEQELDGVLKQEELLWFQKSREQSFLLGDRNTKYFHTQTIVRRRRSRIHSLALPSGEICDQEDVLKREALLFYKSLFCSQVQVSPCSMSSVFPPPLTEAWSCGPYSGSD